jgi:hypothetical protein
MSETSPESVAPPKTIALLLSTMRSGSTLLKALLAQAPDISDLPETDFQKYQGPDARQKIEALSPEPILVLKRPGWFTDIGRYPRMPAAQGVKRIVLVRDAYANGLSARKMVFRHVPWLQRSGLGNRFLVERYWVGVNRRLLQLTQADPDDTLLVRYEDVLRDPRGETARLFAFLGSAQTDGIDTYGKPRSYDWTWGKDDGGAVIKSLKVQAPRELTFDDRKLFATIKNSAAVQSLRQDLGFPTLPAL